MGNSEEISTVKYYIIGIEQRLFDNIFSQYKCEPLENHLAKKIIINNIEISKKKFTVKWEIYFLEQINDGNEEEILKLLVKELKLKNPKDEIEKDEKIDKKDNSINAKENQNFNVLIKFGEENIESLMWILDYQTASTLPQVGIVTKNEFIPKLFYNRFITLIKGDNEDTIQQNLLIYLIERDCYYNQRWDQCIELNPNYSMTTDNISNSRLNILLIGMSRCGKSTFTNLFAEKMIALESPSFESVTTKISEFPIILKSSNKKLFKIRLFDTPGLMEKEIEVKGKKLNTKELVINLINEKLKQCEDSKDDIHCIYFFLGPQSNLEFIKSIFQFLIGINKKRIQKQKFEIPIIFILNENKNQDKLDALKSYFLNEKNKLEDLYKEVEESSQNKKSNKKLTFKEQMSLTKIHNNSIKNNIIGVNLLNSKDSSGNITRAFGFEQIMKATNYFIKKNNPFDRKDIFFLKEKLLSMKYFINCQKSKELSEKDKKAFLILKKILIK